MPLQILNIVSFLFIVSMNKNMLITQADYLQVRLLHPDDTAQQLVLEPRDGHREVNDGCPCADLGAENDNDDYQTDPFDLTIKNLYGNHSTQKII